MTTKNELGINDRLYPGLPNSLAAVGEASDGDLNFGTHDFTDAGCDDCSDSDVMMSEGSRHQRPER